MVDVRRRQPPDHCRSSTFRSSHSPRRSVEARRRPWCCATGVSGGSTRNPFLSWSIAARPALARRDSSRTFVGGAGMRWRVKAATSELARGRPVLTLIEDRPGTFHHIVIVATTRRAVVLHGPARSPFRVMTRDTFTRRWAAADRWMAIVLPASRRRSASDRCRTRGQRLGLRRAHRPGELVQSSLCRPSCASYLSCCVSSVSQVVTKRVQSVRQSF